MAGCSPLPIEISDRYRLLLEALCDRSTSRQDHVVRAKILLAAADPSTSNRQIGRSLDIHFATVAKWRSRWPSLALHLDNLDATLRIEGKTEDKIERALQKALETGLSDTQRPGTPPTFTPEQLVAIIALACEDPQDSERPVTHWTPRELTDEILKREIVPRISVRSVGRFLKRSRFEASSEPILADA